MSSISDQSADIAVEHLLNKLDSSVSCTLLTRFLCIILSLRRTTFGASAAVRRPLPPLIEDRDASILFTFAKNTRPPPPPAGLHLMTVTEVLTATSRFLSCSDAAVFLLTEREHPSHA